MKSQNLVTRRQFVRTAGVAAAAGLLAPVCGRSYGAVATPEKPLLRFVQWNDVHVDSDLSSDFPRRARANEKMKYLVKSLNQATFFPVPDFVIGVGDMINGQKPDMSPDFALLIPLLADLKCRYYPVVGNHEDRQREGDPKYEIPYCKAFGDGRLNYTFQRGNLLFVVLNDSGAPQSNGTDVGRARNRWFRETLASSTAPKIVCCHIPLVPIREEAVLRKSLGFHSYTAHDEELLAAVETPANRVVAVLSGHLHLTGMVRQNGVYHISISGTASYPCDFACYEVFADRIRVRVHRLPDELVTPGTDIHHGKPRYPVDYTDASHATHELYVRGNPSEREFEMALPAHAPSH
jgi:hypothetical protein